MAEGLQSMSTDMINNPLGGTLGNLGASAGGFNPSTTTPSTTDGTVDTTDPLTDPVNPFRQPEPEDQEHASLDYFEKQLGTIVPDWLDADFGAEIFRGIGSGEVDPVTGDLTGDPRFQAFKDSQLGQLSREQQQQQAMTSDFFSRRGLGGSSAQLNQMQNLGTQFGQQRQNVMSQLGMQEMGRQDKALLTAAQLQQQAFDQQAAGLEATTLPYALETARFGLGTLEDKDDLGAADGTGAGGDGTNYGSSGFDGMGGGSGFDGESAPGIGPDGPAVGGIGGMGDMGMGNAPTF